MCAVGIDCEYECVCGSACVSNVFVSFLTGERVGRCPRGRCVISGTLLPMCTVYHLSELISIIMMGQRIRFNALHVATAVDLECGNLSRVLPLLSRATRCTDQDSWCAQSLSG